MVWKFWIVILVLAYYNKCKRVRFLFKAKRKEIAHGR